MSDGFPLAIREAFKHGARGPQHDEALMSAAWGFDPTEIAVPTHLWQGTLDNFGSTPAMAEHLDNTIRSSELHSLATATYQSSPTTSTRSSPH
jgi:hypothetical protein